MFVVIVYRWNESFIQTIVGEVILLEPVFHISEFVQRRHV